MTDTMEDQRYPIGPFVLPDTMDRALIDQYISDIALFPERLRAEVEVLTDAQLDTVYRPGGWTIRQVVHHCADSHMNSLTRFKLALTEEEPTIRPYYEERWAELADSRSMPIGPALTMLEGLHQRWTVLLQSLSEEDLQRTFIHPQAGKRYRLDENIGLYAWHCNHHLAHITRLKQSKGW